MRWMGVPEAEARIVETMCERTKGRVLVGRGLTDNFKSIIGLNLGSALNQQEDQHKGCLTGR